MVHSGPNTIGDPELEELLAALESGVPADATGADVDVDGAGVKASLDNLDIPTT